MPLDPRQQPLTPVQARVLATLMEKARTVPDSYPLTLNGVVTGCNQKSSRDPVLQLTEAEVQEALHALRREGLAVEISGQRATRWEHNFPRGIGVPDQSAVLLALLMLRGPQTAGELRINAERWHRFADISSVEAFLDELQERSDDKGGPWCSCCRAPPVPAKRVGCTCCAAPSTCKRCKRPKPTAAPAPTRPCKSAYRRWRNKWHSCRPKWPACVRNWA